MRVRIRWIALLMPLLLLVLGGVSSGRAHGQTSAPEVTVSIDKSRVTVGDPIALTVAVRHSPDVRIDTTSLDDQLGVLEPLGSDPPDEHAVGPDLELRLRYRVAVYQTGSISVPAFVFDYTLPDGTQGQVTAATPPQLTVESILPAGDSPTDIKGLKPQFSMATPPTTSWPLIAGLGAVVVALLLAAGAAVLIRRRRRAPAAAAPSAALTARVELDRILALDLPAHGDLIEHYRLIAVCIRRYLTERFGFPAVSLTTGELERQMEDRGVERWPARLVCGLLNECDAVVYARYVPAPARAEADNAMAYEIVETLDGAGPLPAARAV